MASITVNLAPYITSGTATVYPRSNWSPVVDPAGAPVGSSVTTGAVAADGSVTFSGLTEGTDYVAYQGSPDRYVRFRQPAATIYNLELGYAERTSNFTTTSTSVVDVTGLQITVTPGSRPFIVDFIAQVQNSSAGQYANMEIYRSDTSTQVAFGVVGLGAANEVNSCHLRRRLSLAAGVPATFKVRMSSSIGTNTATVVGGTTSPATFQVIEI